MEPSISQSPKVNLIEPTWALKGTDDDLYFQHDQVIDDSLLDRAKDLRTVSANSRSSDYMEVADIPVAVVEAWMRQGFNILKDKNITLSDIVKRLSAEDLGGFITTSKQI